MGRRLFLAAVSLLVLVCPGVARATTLALTDPAGDATPAGLDIVGARSTSTAGAWQLSVTFAGPATDTGMLRVHASTGSACDFPITMNLALPPDGRPLYVPTGTLPGAWGVGTADGSTFTFTVTDPSMPEVCAVTLDTYDATSRHADVLFTPPPELDVVPDGGDTAPAGPAPRAPADPKPAAPAPPGPNALGILPFRGWDGATFFRGHREGMWLATNRGGSKVKVVPGFYANRCRSLIRGVRLSRDPVFASTVRNATMWLGIRAGRTFAGLGLARDLDKDHYHPTATYRWNVRGTFSADGRTASGTLTSMTTTLTMPGSRSPYARCTARNVRWTVKDPVYLGAPAPG